MSVTFFDSRKDSSGLYAQKQVDQIKEDYEQLLEQRNRAVDDICFGQFIRYNVKETLYIKDSSLTLDNITVCEGRYLYNFEYAGTDPIAFIKENIFLYITGYENFVFSEKKGSKKCYAPAYILLLETATKKQKVVVAFDVKRQNTFYSQLFVTNKIIFDTRVDLGQINFNYDFKVEVSE